MYRNDRACAVSNFRLHETLVEVQRVWAHVDENGCRAAHNECVCGGGKREGRHDDLVADADLREQGGQLERTSPRMRKQRQGRLQSVLEPTGALPRERSVPGAVATRSRLRAA